MGTKNVLDEIFFWAMNSWSIEYIYFEVQYNQNEHFYLELECGPTQSYLFVHFFLPFHNVIAVAGAFPTFYKTAARAKKWSEKRNLWMDNIYKWINVITSNLWAEFNRKILEINK